MTNPSPAQLADRLSEAISFVPNSQVVTNGSNGTEARRNKYERER